MGKLPLDHWKVFQVDFKLRPFEPRTGCPTASGWGMAALLGKRSVEVPSFSRVLSFQVSDKKAAAFGILDARLPL